MAETPDQVKKHIAVLIEFEEKYGEYIRALEAEWTTSIAAGAIGAPDNEGLGPDWPADEWTQRTRELKMLATRADRAIKASGVAPPAGSADLPTQAFDFEVNHGYFSDDGMSIPRELLERIPSQISGLEIKLEEAEATRQRPASPVVGRLRRRRKPPKELEPWPEDKRPWHENPWLVAIGSGVVILFVTLLLTHYA